MAMLFSWQSCNTEFDYDNMLSTKNDDTEQANQPNFTIEEVQSWYSTVNNNPTNRPQKVKGVESLVELFYTDPDWNNYCINETENYSAIDIDLTLQMQNDLFLDEHKEAYDKNPNWRYLHSYTRMVVLKSKKRDKKIGFLMTLIPSVEYIKNHKDKIRKTTYVKREKDYDGYILFYELDGTFANGWKYKDGKITAAIKEHSGNTDNNNSLIRLWNAQANYTLAKPHKTRMRRVKSNSEEEEVRDGGELKEVVVIGTGKDPWGNASSRWLEEDWNNLNRPGGGDNDFPYPGNSNSGGSGGSAGGYINWYFTSPEPKKDDSTPCAGDPIKEPEIAPSNGWNLKGGTYGYTRNNGKRFHDGIDIKAHINSELYNMHTGVVVDIRNTFKPGEYADRSYGNYIEIVSIINDEKISLRYNHLNQVKVAVGDTILQGKIIGLTGNTGNAQSMKGIKVIPHVHITGRKIKNGKKEKIDPLPYLGTKFDKQGVVKSRPCN